MSTAEICPGLHKNEIHANMKQASLESSLLHNNVYVAGSIKCKLHKKKEEKRMDNHISIKFNYLKTAISGNETLLTYNSDLQHSY